MDHSIVLYSVCLCMASRDGSLPDANRNKYVEQLFFGCIHDQRNVVSIPRPGGSSLSCKMDSSNNWKVNLISG